MALINCRECGMQISTGAKTCPSCGLKLSRRGTLVFILFGFLFFMWFLNPTKNTKEKIISSNHDSHVISKIVKNEKINDSCMKVTNLFGYSSKMTHAQKDDLWKTSYKGKRFSWNAQIASASEQLFDGSYEVVFLCLPPVAKPALLKMYYPEEQKSNVLKFKKGKQYKITGSLSEYEVPPEEFANQVSIRITANPSK